MFSAKAQIDSFQGSPFSHITFRSFHERWFKFHTITYRIPTVKNLVSVSLTLTNLQRFPVVWLTPVWEMDVNEAP